MTLPLKVVAYYRVSSTAQGASGLGIAAQVEYMTRAAKSNNWEVIASFEDITSGKIAIEDRPEGAKALALCKETGAVLAVAKLDRLSRSVAHIAALMERTSFKVCTMPDATPFQLHLFAALAQQEREFISQRTKDTLAALKANAAKGDTKAIRSVAARAEVLARGRTEANRAKATAAVQDRVTSWVKAVRPHITECLHDNGRTLQQVADCLNDKKIATARGGEWSAMQVSRVMKTLGLTFA